jgi:ribonucleoside-diphosphate reductase alpha chain
VFYINMTMILKDGGKRSLPFNQQRLENYISEVMKDFPQLEQEKYKQRIIKLITSNETYRAAKITDKLILNALDNISREEPAWTYVAASFYLKKLYREAGYNRSYDASNKYGSFYGLLKRLGTEGIYSETILKEYSKEEIDKAETFIVPDRDKLFTYIGLKTLHDRYLTKDYENRTFELPQERFLIIALTLMQKEPKEKRLELVNEAYWALSNLYMTVATPTLANAGKSYGQLSSCFIDTVDDSLQSIYDSNTDIANLSKNGGGIN